MDFGHMISVFTYLFLFISADVIPAKRKRKFVTPVESKTITYAENNAQKSSEQSVTSIAKRTEHDGKCRKLFYDVAAGLIFHFIFEQTMNS